MVIFHSYVKLPEGICQSSLILGVFLKSAELPPARDRSGGVVHGLRIRDVLSTKIFDRIAR